MNARRLEQSVRHKFEDPIEVAGWKAVAVEGLRPFEEALISRAFAPGQRILDVGCGGGREAIPMAQARFRIIAMDLSHALVCGTVDFAASKEVSLLAVTAGVDALPFQASTLDGVTLFEQLIAHVPTQQGRIQVLRDIRRALRPGGTLVMTTHNRRCHWKFQFYFAIVNRLRRLRRSLGSGWYADLGDNDRWSSRIGKYASRRPVFFHMYDLGEALEDLHAAGFEVLDARARAEFETNRQDPVLRRRDYCLAFIARRPLEPTP